MWSAIDASHLTKDIEIDLLVSHATFHRVQLSVAGPQHRYRPAARAISKLCKIRYMSEEEQKTSARSSLDDRYRFLTLYDGIARFQRVLFPSLEDIRFLASGKGLHGEAVSRRR
jgi:hypothetical protein